MSTLNPRTAGPSRFCFFTSYSKAKPHQRVLCELAPNSSLLPHSTEWFKKEIFSVLLIFWLLALACIMSSAGTWKKHLLN